MTGRKIAVATVLALILAAPAAAEEPARNDPPSVTLVCKRIQVTGSRFKERVCRTREEWQADAEQAKRTTREMQRLHHGPNGN